MSTVSGITPGRRWAPLWLPAAISLFVSAPAAAQPAPKAATDATPEATTETACDDGKDDDGDMVFDCADADCFASAACQPDGRGETSDARCSDWIDNDSDGYTDCDDSDCFGAGITICEGSWKGKSAPAAGQAGPAAAPTAEVVPELGEGMSVEDLIGTGGDVDGERNDVLCSDGVDNDSDGRVDCADFGCRFDRTVTVCQGDPDFRFSVVARAEHSLDLENETMDSRFSTLQLRAFGPMPYIEDSFFLLSMRVERTPRLTFAMFQIPLDKRGHYVNVNSGGGGLSVALVSSAHKRLLLEPAFYLYNAFEQGNGGAVEVGGPIDKDSKYLFRAFAAGGSGRFSGNVGGTYITYDNTNYTYSVGGQLHLNLIGYWSRWDSPMLYTAAPTTLAVAAGVKYDQRAQERYPAANVNVAFRHGRVIAIGEVYAKRELEFESSQLAYNVQLGVLLIPKRLLLAADFGEFLAGEMENPPVELETDLRRQVQETQWRAALHMYLWRNIFTGSLLYTDRHVDPVPGQSEEQVEREIKVVGQYRF